MFDKLFELAKKRNIEALELYVYEKEEIEFGLFHGEIDKYNVASLKTVSARGIYNGQMGYTTSEKFTPGMEKSIVDNLIKNASMISSKEESVIYPGDEHYEEVCVYNEELAQVPLQEKIARLKELEKKCYEVDSRISEVGDCEYGEVTTRSTIVNSKGLCLERKNNHYVVYVSPITKDESGAYPGMAVVVSNDFNDFDPAKVAEKAVKDALSKVGSAPVNSGKYKVVLQNKIMTSLLGLVISSASAERVQKGQSMFGDKLGKTVASDIVTIVEDPLLKGGLASTSFDDEGVATYKKNIVENGVLTTYLHNLKTAKKAGVKSTGNGYKAGVSSPVGISVVNAYLQPGSDSFEELLQKVGNGLLITDLAGMHSGLDPISGNFSLQAKGFVIENGVKSSPVSLITVAGNLFTLLQQIEAVGSDLDYSFNPSIKSPSVVVKELVIAGK